MLLTQFLATDHSKTTVLIRLMVGAVFLSEGMQKFLYPAMWLGSLFLLIQGGGHWPVDLLLVQRNKDYNP
jgi:hypothetical protein